MIQPGDLQLHHLRQEIRRQIDFPEELAAAVDEPSAQALLAEVAACQTEADLFALTFSLSRRRLNDLFAAVLVISAAAGEQIFGQLLEIFKLRASISLCQVGWAFYQHHFPNDRLARVLAVLISSLAAKEDKPFFIKELAGTALDSRLPEQLAQSPAARPEKHKSDNDLAEETPVASLRDQYPLLAAYTSLTSIPGGKMTADCIKSSLCGYMVRMAILPDAPFAAAFLKVWFGRATDQDILENSNLFVQALRIGHPAARQSLLSRYLADYRLASSWREINLAILELFGIPELSDTAIPPTEAAEAKKPEQAVPAGQPEAETKEPVPLVEIPPPLVIESAAMPQGLFSRLFSKKPKKMIEQPLEQKQTEQTQKPEPSSLPASSAAEPKEEILDQLLANQQPETSTTDQEGSIWQQIGAAAAVRFRQWVFLNKLQEHSADNQRQMLFISRYASFIQAVEEWDDRSLLLDMQGFYLVANKDQADQLWYYDAPTLELLQENRLSQPVLGPDEPGQLTCRDVLLKETPANIVAIPLDSVNLLYAHDFMQYIRARLK